MKVSLNWAQSFSEVPLNEIGTDELVRKIGAQLGAVEEVIEYGPRYDGIVVAKVVSCVKHPDADKLHVCTIDDGGAVQNVPRNDDGHVQVVCGAPNVRAGLTVAWLPPGVTVPSTLDKDPFVLEAREIRGVVSNGMLASSAELAISDNHEGILEIDEPDVEPGHPFKELFGLDDTVVDIENKMFTHRPDCFGVLGVARELAGIQGKQFTSPSWYNSGKLLEFANSHVNVVVETELVPRFTAVSVGDVKVGPSPTWLQAGLSRVGLKPINNIVDMTNYIMYVTGQPLHAYDADKLPVKATLGARTSRKGEKVALLNGKTLELQDDTTVVITSGDEVIGIGGVMGGKDTEVSEQTTNIIIECASFDMYNIRRTSMKYGLFTDAVTRFTKGQSQLQNLFVLAKAVAMTEELAGGKQTSSVADVKEKTPQLPTLKITAKFVNERLGSNLSRQEMAELLRNVEFKVIEEDPDMLEVIPPFWRTDIEIAEDIVEEIGRLHGFDNLPLELPARPAKPASRNPMIELRTRLRNVLSAGGANELISYSFVHGNLLERAGQNTDQAFQLSNALSPSLQYYRTSITPSLLERVHPMVKAGYSQFALFEMGVTHNKLHATDDDGLPKEFPSLSVVTTSVDGVGFYQARAYLDYLANSLSIAIKYEKTGDQEDFPVLQPYDLSRAALVRETTSGEILGVIGEFKQPVVKDLKLPSATAGFELDMDGLLKFAKESVYEKLSKYPSVQQDISLRVPAGVDYKTVYETLASELLGQEQTSAHLAALDIYQRPDDKEHLQYAFRLTISSHDKTLKSEEVNAMLNAAAETAKNQLGAERL